MSRSATGSPRLKPEARRAQLLSAALPCFARKGYEATGTRELARAAGVTEPILYRHFANKADLFRAVLEQVAARLAEAVLRAVAGESGADARLRSLAGALPRILEQCRDELRVLNAAAQAHEVPEIREAAGACARTVGHAVAQAFRGTGLRAGVRAETAGFLLLEVGMGAAMLHPLELPEMEPASFTDRAVQLLLHGISR